MSGLNDEDKNTLVILSEYKLNDDLFRAFRDKHGSEAAHQAKEKLKPAVELYGMVSPDYVETLPVQCTAEFMKPANTLLGFLEELRHAKFDTDHASTFFNEVDQFNIHEFPLVMQTAISSSLFSGEIHRMLTTAKAEREATEELVDQLKKNITDYAIHERANHFAKAANWAGARAILWLLVTGVSFAILLTMAVLNYTHHWPFDNIAAAQNTVEADDHLHIVHAVLSKLLMFGIASYLVVFCGKNYTATRHNATVNRHRQLSLLTYQSLADAAKQTDVILQHAASAIYSHQPTGYSNSKHDDGPSAKTFIDLATQTTKASNV